MRKIDVEIERQKLILKKIKEKKAEIDLKRIEEDKKKEELRKIKEEINKIKKPLLYKIKNMIRGSDDYE